MEDVEEALAEGTSVEHVGAAELAANVEGFAVAVAFVRFVLTNSKDCCSLSGGASAVECEDRTKLSLWCCDR